MKNLDGSTNKNNKFIKEKKDESTATTIANELINKNIKNTLDELHKSIPKHQYNKNNLDANLNSNLDGSYTSKNNKFIKEKEDESTATIAANELINKNIKNTLDELHKSIPKHQYNKNNLDANLNSNLKN